jgi:hypothetical protein
MEAVTLGLCDRDSSGAVEVSASHLGVSNTTGGVVGLRSEFLLFCIPGLPALIGLRHLKSFRGEKSIGMALTQINETDRDCNKVVNGYVKSTR